MVIDGAQDIWANEEGSQQFRKHLEHEVAACQSGQQSILDLVSMPLAIAMAFRLHVITTLCGRQLKSKTQSQDLHSKHAVIHMQLDGIHAMQAGQKIGRSLDKHRGQQAL